MPEVDVGLIKRNPEKKKEISKDRNAFNKD